MLIRIDSYLTRTLMAHGWGFYTCKPGSTEPMLSTIGQAWKWHRQGHKIQAVWSS